MLNICTIYVLYLNRTHGQELSLQWNMELSRHLLCQDVHVQHRILPERKPADKTKEDAEVAAMTLHIWTSCFRQVNPLDLSFSYLTRDTQLEVSEKSSHRSPCYPDVTYS
jgi:hypothetical protein